MQAKDICLLISRAAKGGTGMVAIAGQMLNLVLEDLKLNKNLKVNRVTQSVVVQSGTFGPFNLEADYLRTYDMFYPLQGPNGMTQFLTPVTMEQLDAEFKGTQAANYPYEFATDLSTQAQAATVTPGPVGVNAVSLVSAGAGYLGIPAIAFIGGGAGAAATVTLQLVGAVASAVGAGYSSGDLLTAIGGTFTRPAIVRALTIGGITSYAVVDGGAYTVLPGVPAIVGGVNVTQPIAMTGGTGTGASFTAYWGVNAPTLTANGVYTTVPLVVPVGGTPTTAGQFLATIGTIGGTVALPGQFYIYPQSNGQITLTHRYMKNQPDLVTPETSTSVPWFAFTEYLIEAASALMMGITGDDRKKQFEDRATEILRPHLIMEGDEQQTVQTVRLDPRHFKSNRGARPTKANPY